MDICIFNIYAGFAILAMSLVATKSNNKMAEFYGYIV